MKARGTISLTPALLVLAACATVGPDYDAPATDAFTGNSLVNDEALIVSTDEPAQRWWKSLQDPTLDEIVETAFTENRDLRVAIANVDAARALLRLERTNLRPQGTVDASASRQQVAGATFGQQDVAVGDSDLYEVGLAVGWELDLFGRVRRATEAALADAETAEALRRDAEALLTAETVRAYIEYRGAEVQLAVARRNLTVQRETLTLTQTRLEEGLGSQLDVARAEAQAKTTEATIPPIEAARFAAANRLATLTGTPVQIIEATLARAGGVLPVPPEALAIGDAGALIDRRADVRAAERTLAAATARVGIAKADYFPRITLDGVGTFAAQTTSALGDTGSAGYNAGPRLNWVGFDIPRVRAQVTAAGARAEAAFAGYEQTVLRALEETQTALANYGREKVRFDALIVAAEKAREAAELARIRYDGGVDDFIDVLDAEGRQLAAEAALEESRTAVTLNYAAVFRALGAGWSERPDDLLANR